MDEEKKILKGSWDDLKDWPDIAAQRKRAENAAKEDAVRRKQSDHKIGNEN